MTVLVAKNTKDKIILGADTGIFYGNYHKTHLTDHIGRMKIVSINGFHYSSTGLVSELLNFGLFCQTRKPERSDLLGIQRFFMNFGKWMQTEAMKKEVQIENNYFFVFEGSLFHFEGGAVSQINEGDYATDGAGFKEAYMALYLGKTVKEAIDLTVKMNIWTSGEAQIVEIPK